MEIDVAACKKALEAEARVGGRLVVYEDSLMCEQLRSVDPSISGPWDLGSWGLQGTVMDPRALVLDPRALSWTPGIPWVLVMDPISQMLRSPRSPAVLDPRQLV